MNVEELIEEFETYLRADKKSDSTVEAYTTHAQRFLNLTRKHPSDTTVDDVRSYKAQMSKRLKPASVNVGITAVKTFLALHDNYIGNRVKRVREARKLPIPLTEDEVNRLIDAASKDPLNHALTATLYWTGIRNSSVCNLDLSDILWEEHRLVLRNAKRGKTYTVFIPDQALDAIRSYLQYRVEPTHTSDNDALFINPNTQKRITREAVNWRVKKAAVAAGIKKRVYPHLLRHSHGTIARAKGLALDTIAHQLGHESIQTTQLYAHLADEIYEQEYQSFFDESSSKRPISKPRSRVEPEVDWSYR